MSEENPKPTQSERPSFAKGKIRDLPVNKAGVTMAGHQSGFNPTAPPEISDEGLGSTNILIQKIDELGAKMAQGSQQQEPHEEPEFTLSEEALNRMFGKPQDDDLEEDDQIEEGLSEEDLAANFKKYINIPGTYQHPSIYYHPPSEVQIGVATPSMDVFCRSCGFKHATSDLFCPSCGKRREKLP